MKFPILLVLSLSLTTPLAIGMEQNENSLKRLPENTIDPRQNKAAKTINLATHVPPTIGQDKNKRPAEGNIDPRPSKSAKAMPAHRQPTGRDLVLAILESPQKKSLPLLEDIKLKNIRDWTAATKEINKLSAEMEHDISEMRRAVRILINSNNFYRVSSPATQESVKAVSEILQNPHWQNKLFAEKK